MKNRKRLLILGMVLVLIFAGCSSKAASAGASDTQTSPNSTDIQKTQGQPGGAQTDAKNTGVRGIITAVGASEITIAKNPMQMNSQSQGSLQPGSSTAQQPGDANNQPPQGQQGQTASTDATGAQSIDTSTWEKVTYNIDNQTKIITGGFNNKASKATNTATDIQETTATAADLVINANVVITPRADDESTADTIMIMGTGNQGPSASTTTTNRN